MTGNARDLYLGSLDHKSELNARRLAEMSRIPENDPLWMMLHELQRAAREVTSGANAALADDAFAQRLSRTIGCNVAHNEHVVAALTAAVNDTHETATRAIRSLEAGLSDLVRRHAVAPLASLAFAFALAFIACSVAIWGSFRLGTGYGYDLGYRAGYHDGIIYERQHK